MRSWIVGLLCVALAVFVAARYQDQKVEDIDAEVDALEHAVRVRKEANDGVELADNDKKERGYDLDALTDAEIEELLDELGESKDRRKYVAGGKEKKIIRLIFRRRRRNRRRRFLG